MQLAILTIWINSHIDQALKIVNETQWKKVKNEESDIHYNYEEIQQRISATMQVGKIPHIIKIYGITVN